MTKAKQKEEAREIVREWCAEPLDSKSNATLIDRIASTLSARDREIREVLEGLVTFGDGCWCPESWLLSENDNNESPACLAARALWEKVKEKKNVVK